MVILGALYLIGDPSILSLVLGGVAAVFGLIVGIVGWADTVPPRWFWVKSKVGLFDTLIGGAFSYALRFAFIPFAILGVIAIIEAV